MACRRPGSGTAAAAAAAAAAAVAAAAATGAGPTVPAGVDNKTEVKVSEEDGKN